jgi:hypothetical protein
MLGSLKNPVKVFWYMIKCRIRIHSVDRHSTLRNGSHYYGVCVSCQCLMRRRSRNVWRRWPVLTADRPGAKTQFEGATTRGRSDAEAALKREARAQTLAKLGSLEANTFEEGH